jgi:hypothetical protein
MTSAGDGVGVLVALLAVVGIPLIGTLAVILGIVALVRIGRSGGALTGRGLAIGAIVIGALMILVAPVVLVGALVYARTTARDEVHVSVGPPVAKRPAAVRIDESKVRPDVAGLIRSTGTCSFDSEREEILLPLAQRTDLVPEEQRFLVSTAMGGMDMDEGRTNVLKALIANPAFCAEASAAISALAGDFDFDASRQEILKLLAGRSFPAAVPAPGPRSPPPAEAPLPEMGGGGPGPEGR